MQRERQRERQSASKTQCMLFFHKQGVQGFKICYWLSSCDDKDKDKDKDKVKDKDTFLRIFRGEYFSGVNVFQG